MSKVAIVTDSSAYLPEEFVKQYDIHVVPLQLIWAGETFRDGVDIQPVEFYTRLQSTSVMPTTSQPSAAEFITVFEKLHNQGAEILAMLISSKLSGTIASAEQAKQMLPDARIEIVDSQCASTELSFHLLEVARAAANGADLAACKEIAQNARSRSGIVFAVDTLEFLHRGGRIGGGKRFLGSMLNIKPILDLQEGSIEAVESVRTRRKAHARLVELLLERTQGQTLQYVGVSHADAQEDAAALLASVQQVAEVGETLLIDLSPAIGTHVGPGTLTLSYMCEEM